MLRGRAHWKGARASRARAASAAAIAVWLLAPVSARAGSFDAAGSYRFDPAAVAVDGFSKPPVRYVPSDAPANCESPMFTAVRAPDALEGGAYVTLAVTYGCAERFAYSLPRTRASYRASVWMRHGSVNATIVVDYDDASGLDALTVRMSPTGRTTSDGWVELATNPFPVDGTHLVRAYLRAIDYASQNGVDLDGFEIVREGTFVAQSDCAGVGDPACGEDEVCIYGRCIYGPAAVPVLPDDVFRNDVVDVLEGQLDVFFGGHFSRQAYLPAARAKLEAMRSEKRAWRFWNGWASAVHALHDWHTLTDMSVTGLVGPRHRLNACFFEGDADLSHDAAPSDSRYADVLVSHAGPNAAGLKAGDRLIAVDGVHPLAWAASLADVDWGFHIATDPTISAELAEGLGGPSWGGSLIVRYAREITVLRCSASASCNGMPETIRIADLPAGGSEAEVACDNRPFYHLGAAGPDASKHYVFGTFFRGPIDGTTPEEAIQGLVWDTLYGGDDAKSAVNTQIDQAVADWKASARGVILDHRAGNGGTLDAATNLTRLVRPPSVVAVTRMPMELGGDDGPSMDEGVAIFTSAAPITQYSVGAEDWAKSLPVALILHRDGSASDYLPFGMKGAPHVRIFGPHPTAGAFSTFIELSGWGGLYYQFASGDTIAADGHTLLGHGVAPDVTLLPKQSDLVAGKDTLFEAALAWVRQEVTP